MGYKLEFGVVSSCAKSKSICTPFAIMIPVIRSSLSPPTLWLSDSTHANEESKNSFVQMSELFFPIGAVVFGKTRIWTRQLLGR